MNILINIWLIITIPLIIYISDGWWDLMAFLPFLALISRFGNENTAKKKLSSPEKSFENKGSYNYHVIESVSQMEHKIKSLYPVRINGQWAEFTDEITDDGKYIPHAMFYEPSCIKMFIDVDESKLN